MVQQPYLHPHVHLKSGSTPVLKQEPEQEPKKRPQGAAHLPVGSSTPWQPHMQVRGHPVSSSAMHRHSGSQAQQQPAQALPATGSNPGVQNTTSQPGSQTSSQSGSQSGSQQGSQPAGSLSAGSQPGGSRPAGSQPAGSQATGSPPSSQPRSQSGPLSGLQPASQPGSQTGAQTAQAGSQPASDQMRLVNNSTPGSAAAAAAAETPPERDGQKISCDDIQLVQNLIERCLQLYLNQREVITSLQYHAKIGPDFTSLVWQKLEEQNPEFFKAYYVRLKLKEQIHAFNNLLACQVHKMEQMQLSYKQQAMPQGNALAPATGIPANGVRGHGPIAPMGYPATPMQTGIGTPHRLLPMAPATGQPVVNGTPVPGSYVGPSQATSAANPMMDMMIGLTPPMGTAATGIPAVSSDITLGNMGPAPTPPMSMPTVQGFPFGNMSAPGSDMVGIGLGTALPLEHAYEASLTASDTSTPSAMNSLSLTMPEAESQKESLSSLGALPRNFSLSDLAGELNNNMGLDGGLLASLSDSSPLLTPDPEDFLQSPDKDDLDDDQLLDFD